MKARIWIGAGVLGAVGIALLAHKRHGGTMSFESLRQSMRDLLSFGRARAAEVKDRVVDKAGDFASAAREQAKRVANHADIAKY